MTETVAYVSALGMTSAAGSGCEEIMANLRQGLSPGMIRSEQWTPGREVLVGAVAVDLPSLAEHHIRHRTRTNQLAWHGSLQIDCEIRDAVATFGPGRVGVVVGTTTSGMAETERAIAEHRGTGRLPDTFAYAHLELGSPSEFLARTWGIDGPAYTVSTACSSSAKALASARRLLRIGACDAVLAGGVDTLCAFTLLGFSALGALSSARCLPFSRNRNGICIGEAAAMFMLRRDRGAVAILGVGETSDAYNISAPHPDGAFAQAAMTRALSDAGLVARQIGYVNLHGTGTRQNDAMEAIAMQAVFPGGVPCSSTKPLTGHTLGAAGALEAGICAALLSGTRDGGSHLPVHVYDDMDDPELPHLDLVRHAGTTLGGSRYAMSNVFGFGGTNVSVVLGAG